MFKRISVFAVLTFALVAMFAVGMTTPILAGSPRSPQRVPSQLYTGPITLLSANITQTITTTARFYGDATYLDTYLTIVAGTGNVTATLWTSSNAADWALSTTPAIASTGTNTVTRYTAHGAYYRFVVTTNSATITPTLRTVQKP